MTGNSAPREPLAHFEADARKNLRARASCQRQIAMENASQQPQSP
jgi:hypothetical protein